MYAVIDVETGGFSKEKNGLCEIAVIIVDSSFSIVKSFSFLIQPYLRPESDELVSYKDAAMEVNGIKMEDLLKAPKAEVVAKYIERVLIDQNITTIVGHNVKSMDQKWTEYFLERFASGFKFKEAICTLDLARKSNLDVENNKLPTLCKYYGIVNNDEHRASGDTHATYLVWMELKKELNE